MMSIINQKYTSASPAEAKGRGQVKGKAAQTDQSSLKKVSTNASLSLQWFRLPTPTAGAGQAGQRLHSRWRLKQADRR